MKEKSVGSPLWHFVIGGWRVHIGVIMRGRYQSSRTFICSLILPYFGPEPHLGLKKLPDPSQILIRRKFGKPHISIRTRIISRNQIKKKCCLEMIRSLQLLMRDNSSLIRGKIIGIPDDSISNVSQRHSLRKSIFFLDPEFTDLKKVPQKREAIFSVSQGFWHFTRGGHEDQNFSAEPRI